MRIRTDDGRELWIYRNDQCKYCKHRIEGCDSWHGMQQLKMAIDKLEKEIKFYGSIDFKCDYFWLDETAYMRDREFDVCCEA